MQEKYEDSDRKEESRKEGEIDVEVEGYKKEEEEKDEEVKDEMFFFKPEG